MLIRSQFSSCSHRQKLTPRQKKQDQAGLRRGQWTPSPRSSSSDHSPQKPGEQEVAKSCAQPFPPAQFSGHLRCSMRFPRPHIREYRATPFPGQLLLFLLSTRSLLYLSNIWDKIPWEEETKGRNPKPQQVNTWLTLNGRPTSGLLFHMVFSTKLDCIN